MGCSRVTPAFTRWQLLSSLTAPAANLLVRSAPRGTRTPNRQIRSLPGIVRSPVVRRRCSRPRNLLLSVRLVFCSPPVLLSFSVKKSVNPPSKTRWWRPPKTTRYAGLLRRFDANHQDMAAVVLRRGLELRPDPFRLRHSASQEAIQVSAFLSRLRDFM